MVDETGKPDVAALVQAYAPMVKRLALRLVSRLPPNVELDDLIQCGMMGLIEAIERYRDDDRAEFETYALARIRGAMIDALRETDWVPRQVRKEMRRVEEAIAALELPASLMVWCRMTDADLAAARACPVDILHLSIPVSDIHLQTKLQRSRQWVLEQACAVLDGRDARLLQWITDSQIAVIATDNYAVEAFPARPGAACCAALPLHEHCLFKLGVHLGELWHLTPLAHWLREHGRHRFLLTAPPLNLPGAIASPVTPVATV